MASLNTGSGTSCVQIVLKKMRLYDKTFAGDTIFSTHPWFYHIPKKDFLSLTLYE